MKSTFLMEFCELKQLTAAQRPHIYSKEEENSAKILINFKIGQFLILIIQCIDKDENTF